MSAEELRNLVAQLQEDLMETARQKEQGQGQIQKLQHKLAATENTVRHISRKLKSSRPVTTADCFHTQNPAARRSQSESSIHRGDHWSRICQGMLNEGDPGSGGQRHWFYEGPLRDSSEWEPYRNPHNGTSHHSVTSGRSKLSTGITDAKRQTSPSPRLQRIRTRSSSCILSPRTISHSPNEMQLTNPVKQAKENTSTNKSFTDGNKTSSSVDMVNPAIKDVNNSLKLKTTIAGLTTSHSAGDFYLTGLPQTSSTIPIKDHAINNTTNSRINGQVCEDSPTQSPAVHRYEVPPSTKQSTTIKQHNLPQHHPSNCISTGPHTKQYVQMKTTGDNTGTSHIPYPYTSRSCSSNAFNFDDKPVAAEQDSGDVVDMSSKGGYSLSFSSKPETEILTQLQHLLGEKEEMWKTKTMEIKQRMKKENFLLMQENELLNEEVKLLQENANGKDKAINELKQLNEKKDEDQKKLAEEIKTLKREKAEIEMDLANQDQELIDLDKTLCKIEITKKESDIQKRRKIDELEENKKELTALKKELQYYTEANKSLKDSLIKREASLHEQIFTVRKLRAERDINEPQSMISRTPDIIKTERDFQRTKSLNEKHNRTIGGYSGTKLVYKREGQHELLQHITNLKEEVRELQEEVAKLKAEKERANANFSLQISDMERQVADKVDLENRLSQAEFELKNKKGLDEEIANLRSQLDKKFRHEMKMRAKITESEAVVSTERTQLLATQRELQEKIEKLKRRDKQCQELCEKFGKLDSAYIKQTRLLREKNDNIDFLKKRLRDYEIESSNKTTKYSNTTYGDERNIGSKL